MSSTSLLRALNQPLRGPSMGKILREQIQILIGRDIV